MVHHASRQQDRIAEVARGGIQACGTYAAGIPPPPRASSAGGVRLRRRPREPRGRSRLGHPGSHLGERHDLGRPGFGGHRGNRDRRGREHVSGRYSCSSPAGRGVIFLVKIAPDDSITWQRTWDGPGTFTSHEARESPSAPMGPSASQQIHRDCRRLASEVRPGRAPLLWQQRWDSGGTEQGDGVAVGADGSIYVAGATGADGGNILLLKFTSDGTLTWSKTWWTRAAGKPAWRSDPMGTSTSSGLTAGTDGTFGSDAALFKVDPAGSLLMQTAYSGLETADARGGVAVAETGPSTWPERSRPRTQRSSSTPCSSSSPRTVPSSGTAAGAARAATSPVPSPSPPTERSCGRGRRTASEPVAATMRTCCR